MGLGWVVWAFVASHQAILHPVAFRKASRQDSVHPWVFLHIAGRKTRNSWAHYQHGKVSEAVVVASLEILFSYVPHEAALSVIVRMHAGPDGRLC